MTIKQQQQKPIPDGRYLIHQGNIVKELKKTRPPGAVQIAAALIAERLRAFEEEKAPDFSKMHADRARTKQAQYLLRAFKHHHLAAERLKARLEKSGLDVHTYKGYSLSVSYKVTSSLRERYDHDRKVRRQQIKDMKIAAAMALLGMNARQAKGYLLTLKKYLAAV